MGKNLGFAEGKDDFVEELCRFVGMSALSTLKKFFESESKYGYERYNHPHSDAVLEWFLEKYWGKKEVKITLDNRYIVIDAECIKYLHGKNKNRIDKIYKRSEDIWGIEEDLMLCSANYCKYCRDNRRRFWEKHREIIERLPRNVRKFVVNLPMIMWLHNYAAVLSGIKEIYIHSWSSWYINHDLVSVDKVLKEFRKEYNAAKRFKFSEKCWRFADASILCMRPI